MAHKRKSVKGDVIASLVITVVNILGGLAIGVGQKGMPAVDALKRYGLLTIGDGLVSQIPALVLSTAAGVLVTRVASEDPDTPLGQELASQLFGMPKALRVAAGFVLVLAVVPGLPAVPFLVIAAVLFLIARTRSAQLARSDRRDVVEPSAVRRADAAFVPVVLPWILEVSSDLATALEDAPDRPGLRSAILALRERLFVDLGVPLPSPRARVASSLPPRHAVIPLFEVPARIVAVPEGADDGEMVRLLTTATTEFFAHAPAISSASPRRSASSTSSSRSRRRRSATSYRSRSPSRSSRTS